MLHTLKDKMRKYDEHVEQLLCLFGFFCLNMNCAERYLFSFACFLETCSQFHHKKTLEVEEEMIGLSRP